MHIKAARYTMCRPTHWGEVFISAKKKSGKELIAQSSFPILINMTLLHTSTTPLFCSPKTTPLFIYGTPPLYVLELCTFALQSEAPLTREVRSKGGHLGLTISLTQHIFLYKNEGL